MSDGVRCGNCISYGGYACRGGGAQRSIVVICKIIPYSLFTYISTRGSSTSSLKKKQIIHAFISTFHAYDE